MSDEADTVDVIEFDEVLQLALAESAAASSGAPSPDLRRRLMERVAQRSGLPWRRLPSGAGHDASSPARR